VVRSFHRRSEEREGYPAIGDSPPVSQGHAVRSRHQIPQLGQVVRRQLDQIDAVTRREDLRTPPGNRLHALTGSLAEYHVIRVNGQDRVVSRFKGQEARDVRCAE